eukprot:g20259.t1
MLVCDPCQVQTPGPDTVKVTIRDHDFYGRVYFSISGDAAANSKLKSADAVYKAASENLKTSAKKLKKMQEQIPEAHDAVDARAAEYQAAEKAEAAAREAKEQAEEEARERLKAKKAEACDQSLQFAVFC